MPLARHGHACGPWRSSTNPLAELLVVGGVGAEESTLIYNLDDDEWREGPAYEYDQFRYYLLLYRTHN